MKTKELERKAEEFIESCIAGFAGEIVDPSFEHDVPYSAEFIGTVFSIMPSRKYYMPFACSNVSPSEAAMDEVFRDTMEETASEHGYWLESGEGDPCDIFLCRHLNDKEKKEYDKTHNEEEE